MIDESTMYWITRLDHICSVLTGLAIASGIIGSIMTIIACASHCMAATDEDCKATARMSKTVAWITMPIFVFCLFAGALVPTTKEYAAIKLIPAIVNNQQVQSETKDVYDLLKDWLKDKVQAELPPEKGKR
jgi:cytochrome bd-type quinol oxidase subunit 2